MSDSKLPSPPVTEDSLVRIASPQLDLNSVLVVDPAVLNADSDPQADWIRATTEGFGEMGAEEWTAWVAEFQLFAA